MYDTAMQLINQQNVVTNSIHGCCKPVAVVINILSLRWQSLLNEHGTLIIRLMAAIRFQVPRSHSC